MVVYLRSPPMVVYDSIGGGEINPCAPLLLRYSGRLLCIAIFDRVLAQLTFSRDLYESSGTRIPAQGKYIPVGYLMNIQVLINRSDAL